MTTRRHPPEHPEGEERSPIEARLEARIAQQQAAAKTAEHDKLEAELAEARQKYLRLAADFENFKKRTRQDQLDTIQHASSELIGRLLPVLDDLRSALEHQPEGVDEAWAKGIELSVRKLEEVMSTHGLEPIASVGSRFDPRYHEAIGHVESDEHPEDTVVSELRRGYRIRDRVVRPSLVRVSRKPELPSAGVAHRPSS
ncbi:MAG TPA: nucleotide exchange factor GrpE [Candidatus Dormibacteraeota bacterium]|nr:nucleotide exchange factor GrpE [Candidatus Dormibacteraeota bacterium]